MHVTRIHADQIGESHFENIEISPSTMETPPSALRPTASSPLSATRVIFAEFPRDWLGDWHPASRRQFWVGVAGAVEVTVSDGEVRLFGPGSVILLEDLSGRGHVTRVVSERGAQAMLIHL